MNWEQKLDAIQSLAGSFDVSLKMRGPGNWYVHTGLEVGGDGMLASVAGNGTTPEEAVNDIWRKYTDDMKPGRFIVVDSMGKARRQVRWNGFTWKDVA
jgi:hypothetical protein